MQYEQKIIGSFHFLVLNYIKLKHLNLPIIADIVKLVLKIGTRDEEMKPRVPLIVVEQPFKNTVEVWITNKE
jgi:hypothetical protein